MKVKILLLALFAAGIASSFALASPGHGRGRGQGGEEGAPATAPEKAHGKAEHESANTTSASCRNVSLKGTLDGATVSLAVTRGSKAARGLLGTTVSLSATGPASVQARVCGIGTGQTLELRVLKVAEQRSDQAPTTTGETTTAATTTSP